MKLKTALLGAACAFAIAPAAMAERGTDGNVKVLYSQAVSILNPYLSAGTKDVEVSSITLEPLAGFDPTGTMFPRLVSELPSLENGGIAADLTSVTWKITPGLLWSDGTAFTADDVVFTAAYCMDPAGGCAQLAKYEGVKTVEAIDPLTVKITYNGPKPNPLVAFVGAESPIIQKAQFANCLGAAAPTCTEQNFHPVGTGPFMVTDFKVNDSVEFVINPNYRDPAKPAFASLSVKGGGDAASAARAVMETGEFDYAWNTQINPELQAQMAAGGKGKFVSGFSTLVERIEMNMTDPSADLPEGERSTAKHPHPILSDVNVRKALSMAIDRELLVQVGYGAAGRASCNLVPAPAVYASPNTDCMVQDMDGAKALLDAAGWVPGADGIREKDGKRFKLLYQTSVNPVRQDFQALIKGWWNELGVEVELKTVDGGVFFGGDPSSPDTFQKFYADVQMYANNFPGTDPEAYILSRTCNKAPRPESQWQGENINRYCDPVFDELGAKLIQTQGEAERAAIIIRMNEMLTKDTYTVVPLVDRGTTAAHSNTLGGVTLNVWDATISNLDGWYRVK